MTSKIKVDNIADQDDNNIINESGDVITVGASGDTVAVAGNIVKSNAYQAADGGSIISQSGTTITIGASGDTVSLASGASQTGFGRTGTVNWDTTAKTASFTAVSGNGYFVNTTSGAITVTAPASPSAGDIFGIKDYAGTFETNNVTVDRNGSLFDGATSNAVLETDQLSVFFVYVDGTQGWKATQSDAGDYGARFVAATGGTVITCGNFKTHVFTGPGTFTVSCAGNTAGSNTVDYFVVAGGGAATGDRGGGGGAGGFRVSNSVGCIPAPTMSPLANPTGLSVSAQGYPITVAAGGTAASPPIGAGGNGSSSTFSTITSTGGGGSAVSGSNTGGSGSGGYCGAGGAGNTPPVSPPQGNPGGLGAGAPKHGAGGGGGAGATGSDGTTGGTGGAGGVGSFVAVAFINPGCAPTYGTPGPVSSTRYFAGGGGGSAYGDPGPINPGPGGAGGGGASSGCSPKTGTPGTTNTGGGGGGGTQKSGPGTGGTGGSGIVMIRYKFQ